MAEPKKSWKGLAGKVIMITGASSGLGREFALTLAKSGCNIVATARRSQLLESLCKEIEELNSSGSNLNPLPGKAMAIQLDISATNAAIDAVVATAWQIFGRIDVLINNAGLRGDVHCSLDLEEDEWNKVLATNVRGSWLVSKAVAKRMRDAKQGGSIINISSIAGLERGHLPGGVAYAVSKAGVNSMTKVMALELGKYNIRVNALAPGLFRSEITAGLMEKDWLSGVAKKIVPLQTWGESDPALTSTVQLLASDDCAYITGNIFVVDGGQSLAALVLLADGVLLAEFVAIFNTNTGER